MMLEVMEIKKHYGKSVPIFNVLKKELKLPDPEPKPKTLEDYKAELGIQETEEQKQ